MHVRMHAYMYVCVDTKIEFVCVYIYTYTFMYSYTIHEFSSVVNCDSPVLYACLHA